MGMRRFLKRVVVPRLIMVVAAFTVATVPSAHAAPVVYTANLSGPNESPPNASPGTGFATVTIDAVAHMMRVQATFSGLVSGTTASHIHAATAVAGSGTAGVATTTPTFAGFPLGVTEGTYDHTLDMTLASSYNPSFITAQGGLASAEAFLFQSIADGKAYFNIHTTVFSGGEIRGFLTPYLAAVPQAPAGPRPTLRLVGANPFRTELRLAYALPRASRVEVTIHDLTGRRVQTLARGVRAPGEYEARWGGEAADGSRSAPGLYFACLRTDGMTTSLRVIRVE